MTITWAQLLMDNALFWMKEAGVKPTTPVRSKDVQFFIDKLEQVKISAENNEHEAQRQELERGPGIHW